MPWLCWIGNNPGAGGGEDLAKPGGGAERCGTASRRKRCILTTSEQAAGGKLNLVGRPEKEIFDEAF
jgi:hypothetical protein